MDAALAILLFVASALPHSYYAQWNIALVSKHSLYEKLKLFRLRYVYIGAKAALLRARYFGERSSYVWALEVNWYTLNHRAIMNDFYG